MLELVKYIIAQFAEKPEEIEYKVEENDNSVEITVVFRNRIWARLSADKARSQRR